MRRIRKLQNLIDTWRAVTADLEMFPARVATQPVTDVSPVAAFPGRLDPHDARMRRRMIRLVSYIDD